MYIITQLASATRTLSSKIDKSDCGRLAHRDSLIYRSEVSNLEIRGFPETELLSSERYTCSFTAKGDEPARLKAHLV